MFKRLNSIQWKLTLSHFLVSSLIAVLLLFTLLQTTHEFSQTDLMPSLRAKLYESFVYDSNGNIEIETVFENANITFFCIEPLDWSGFRFNTDNDSKAINECPLKYRSIGLPFREGGYSMYQSIVSVSIWDSEKQLVSVIPNNLERELSQISGPQEEVLNWALEDSLNLGSSFVASGQAPPQLLSRYTDSDTDIKTAAIPLFNNQKTEVLGVVLVQTGPLDYIHIDPNFFLFSGGILLGCLLIAFTGSFLISRNLRKRISTLQGYTSTWADGDLAVRVDDQSPDEIGLLSADLNQMAGQLEELIDAKSLLASVETRQQLARDLHDAAKQQLFAANMQLSAVNSLIETEPKKARTHLDNASDLTKQAQQELSAVINELRPVQLSDANFEEAVYKLTSDFARQQGIQVEIDQSIEKPIPANKQQGLFKILQEGLSNIAKHSEASQTLVTLTSDSGGVTLKIQDDGSGFDVEQSPAGFGLESMRQRIERLNGTLEIDSSAEGTTINVTC